MTRISEQSGGGNGSAIIPASRRENGRAVRETPAHTSASGVSMLSVPREENQYLPPVEEYKAFPSDILPTPLKAFIKEASKSIGCDPSFVALPLLAGLAAAIGNTRRIKLKPDWAEYPILWTCIVARSGERKTPPFDAALKPLRDVQSLAVETWRQEMAAYKQALAQHKKAVSQWNKSGDDGGRPDEPVKPVMKRFIVGDVTVEALAPLLESSPRGLLAMRDELSGWFTGFNQYKSGGKGSDASQWLELYRGGTLMVDRRSTDRPPIYVPRASASVTGTIQPGILRRGLTREHFENGLAARLLLAMPPSTQRFWSEHEIRPSTRDGMNAVYLSLLALDFDAAGKPIDVPLTDAARKAFIEFVNQHGAEQAALEDDNLKAAYSKLEGAAARFALIIHLIRVAISDSTLASEYKVDEASVRAGVLLARWFGREAGRVYATIHMTEEEREIEGLRVFIQDAGFEITPSYLNQSRRKRYRTSSAARAALQQLVAMGLGRWDVAKASGDPKKGGRPTEKFILFSEGEQHRNPAGAAVRGGFPTATSRSGDAG